MNLLRIFRFGARAGMGVLMGGWLLLAARPATGATALDTYVHAPDTNFAWRVLDQWHQEGFAVTRIGFISQRWQGALWTNFIWVVEPPTLSHPEVAALFIGADNGTNLLREAAVAAQRAGAWAVVLSRIPNQPLYDGRREDELIAYTFDHFLRTGEETWPLLLPMVKSSVRAMDVTQAWLEQEHRRKPEKFVVTGASKRGWTTWLTAAVDARVAAIAPRVFDMLNMEVQTAWARKVYGHQSEKIHDYTDTGLLEELGTPEGKRLCEIVDPYTYRDRLRMPKLVLLGANDPYWTVDSTRNYWNDLPGPKLLFDTPNAGHGLGRDSQQSFAAFFQLIAEGTPLPELTWKMTAGASPGVKVASTQPAKSALLWRARSATRDFRPAKWTSRELLLKDGGREMAAALDRPESGYLAFMVELTFATSAGQYKLSTQVQVTPDEVPKE